ncbi:MAG: DnaJ domain-containing protein [Chitinophagaceae bacterium]|nr:DnaJ domain-containing protein [Chitinophagaceae bacterium]MCW5927424.1 DnaJ domain-containing protein [Chitinophagaceae bacterium]
MAFKDYYRILGVSPDALPDDIKKRFRLLALQYHPDRNEGEFAVIRFREMQEAYNVLSNQHSRVVFHKEWRVRNPDVSLSAIKELSPETLLQESKALLQYIQNADIYRFNKDLVFTKLKNILCEENMAVLLQAGDRQKNAQIVQHLMIAGNSLSWKCIRQVFPSLRLLSENSSLAPLVINGWRRRLRINDFWARFYPWAAFIIAFLICILIYRLSKQP